MKLKRCNICGNRKDNNHFIVKEMMFGLLDEFNYFQCFKCRCLQIAEIPKTKNGKLVELAVKQSIEGEEIKNLESLANPDSLKQFKNIKELNE